MGLGGSGTLNAMGIYERLETHNTVFWHWKQPADEARRAAMQTQVYLTSANALAETGEIINIDGVGNRLAGTLFGHEKVYFVIGRNKLAPDYEKAVWRARNVAGPHRAQQLGKKTPCAVKADRCYDCKSPGPGLQRHGDAVGTHDGHGGGDPSGGRGSGAVTGRFAKRRLERRRVAVRLHRVICLLWACLALTGCSALLEREYATVEPHSSKFWESEAAGTLRAENYQDIVNDLLILIGQHTESAAVRLYKL